MGKMAQMVLLQRGKVTVFAMVDNRISVLRGRYEDIFFLGEARDLRY